MDAKKKRKLQKMGGRVTTVAEFLDLSDAEQAIIELRLELATAVRKRRTAARVTQAALAKAIGSSQARIAKMEGGDPQASIESLIRALAALGANPRLKVAYRAQAPRFDRYQVQARRVVRGRTTESPAA